MKVEIARLPRIDQEEKIHRHASLKSKYGELSDCSAMQVYDLLS